MKTVTHKDWKNRPMPERRSQIAVDREFSMGEMERIKRGYLPAEMEEKWFLYFSRNRLYLHRSWTGFCVFIAHFKRKQDSFVLQLIEANRDDAQYSQKDDVYDAQPREYGRKDLVVLELACCLDFQLARPGRPASHIL